MIHENFSETQDIDGLEYNPEKSKKLLAEAGYTDGFKMELVHYQGSRLLMADLAAVGITAVINKIYSTVNRETLMKGTFCGFTNYVVPNVDATFKCTDRRCHGCCVGTYIVLSMNTADVNVVTG